MKDNLSLFEDTWNRLSLFMHYCSFDTNFLLHDKLCLSAQRNFVSLVKKKYRRVQVNETFTAPPE